MGLLPIQQPTLANVGEAIGMGSQSAALAGTQTAWSFDAFSVYGNPASILASPDPQKKMKLGAGFVLLHPSFDPITDIVIENSFTGDQPVSSPRTGTIDTQYKETLGTLLGATYKLSPKLGFGFSAFMPLLQVSYVDSGDTYNPEYILYRARTQRPTVNAAGSFALSETLLLGAGAMVGFSTTASGFVFLNTSASTTSSMRVSASIKPKAAPYLGLLLNQKNFTFGTTLRFPLDSGATVRVEGGARALGPLAGLDFRYTADSSLYYDPWSIEWGASYLLFPLTRLIGQLDFQLWSKYQPSTLIIEQPSVDDLSSSGIVIRPTTAPDMSFKNIFVPRLGIEQSTASQTLFFRLGYGYRPSILAALPTGTGNYLDPPKHMFSGGVGFEFKRFLAFETPCSLDIHGSLHILQNQSITKELGDEAGNTSGFRIGYPGYTTGGTLYGGGVSFSVRL